ncbi:hypothetical protein ACVWXO_005459 [Bradyrhizobium sp. LM2.7]
MFWSKSKCAAVIKPDSSLARQATALATSRAQADLGAFTAIGFADALCAAGDDGGRAIGIVTVGARFSQFEALPRWHIFFVLLDYWNKHSILCAAKSRSERALSMSPAASQDRVRSDYDAFATELRERALVSEAASAVGRCRETQLVEARRRPPRRRRRGQRDDGIFRPTGPSRAARLSGSE